MFVYLFVCCDGEHEARLKRRSIHSCRKACSAVAQAPWHQNEDVRLQHRMWMHGGWRDVAAPATKNNPPRPHGTAAKSCRVHPELDKIPCGYYYTNIPILTCLTFHQIDSLDGQFTCATDKGEYEARLKRRLIQSCRVVCCAIGQTQQKSGCCRVPTERTEFCRTRFPVVW